MTQKFKFGDLVRLKTNGVTGIVVRVGSQSNIWVIFDGYTIAEICKAEELELIPHPDTVRIDWLADKNNNMGSVLLPTTCVENHLDSLRDAIDATMAMKLSDFSKKRL